MELLIEFGQWLCVKDFPMQDSIDQLEWAIDIMLNMQVEADAKKEEGKGAELQIRWGFKKNSGTIFLISQMKP